MPRVTIDDLTTAGRRVEVVWRRDEQEPGYVQVATHPDGGEGEYVHLDADRIDFLVGELLQAKQNAYGEIQREPAVDVPEGERAATA